MSPPVGPQRVFGGQVAAQALVAAGRTVDPAALVHSLHGYFVRPGDPTEPIDYEVENIRDGRSFSVRRVGRPASTASRSSSCPRRSSGRGGAGPPAPGAAATCPARTTCRRMAERLAPLPASGWACWARIPRPLDVRYVASPAGCRPGTGRADPHQRVWMRIDGKLPDDPLLHACALTFASDLTLLDSVLSVHGEVWGPGGVVGASLDHALWFHRPFRADEWFLYDCSSPSASGARGLATGRMFTGDGRHIASAVQEGLLRRVGG